MSRISGPGANVAFDFSDLDQVRALVVTPVIEAMLAPLEVRSVGVGWRRGGSHGDELRSLRRPGDDLLVVVEAADSTLTVTVWESNDLDDYEATRAEVAERLADRVEDWIPERVAWGELRARDITLPLTAP